MAIGKAAAEAAITALKACKAAEMFDKIGDNQHSIEKHFSKKEAKQGALDTGFPQGYFKRLTYVHITSSEDFQKQGDKIKSKAMAAVNAAKAKDFGRKLGQREIDVPKKSPAAKDNILDIINGVIASPARAMHESADNPNTRFLAVAPVPAGFYGRSIDGQGDKLLGPGQKPVDLPYAVVVVNAAAAGNPQIVTVIPATAAYVNGKALLT